MKTTLKTLRKHARKGAELDPGYNTRHRGTAWETKTPVLYSFSDAFCDTQNAGDVIDMRYTGWFNDSDRLMGTTRGIVVSFPARPGFPEGWHIAGTVDSDTDERVYFMEVYDCLRDAARAADREAESIADINREYNDKWQEARELEDKIEDRLQTTCERIRIY